MWLARREARRKLREVEGRLRKPEIAFAFAFWSEVLMEKWELEKRAKMSELQRRELQLQSKVCRLESEIERTRADCDAKLGA